MTEETSFFSKKDGIWSAKLKEITAIISAFSSCQILQNLVWHTHNKKRKKNLLFCPLEKSVEDLYPEKIIILINYSS